MMLVADKRSTLVLTGTGDVLEPERDLMGIGSGGNYALAAARALIDSRHGCRDHRAPCHEDCGRHLRIHQRERGRRKPGKHTLMRITPSLAWACLLLAGVLEVGFTTSMRYLDWTFKLWPIVGFVGFASLSFGLLIAALQVIPLGTAYAVWTGLGAAGTALVGILYYGEPATALRLLFLALLIGSIVGLKLVSSH